MYLFESLNQLIQNYLPEDQIKRLRQAYLVARDAHEGQTRSSGEPYITHPVAVACILAEMKLDYETLMAALLHDVIEDTPATYQDMEQLFGKSVAELVEGVSKLDKLKFRDKKEAQAENFRKMIMAMVQDIRVILIKLADRTHNMRTLGSLRPDKRRRIARETLEIYSPLAHRLGIHHIKTELEELGFEALYPNRYRVIKEVVKAARGNRKEMIQKILSEIEGRLQEAGIPAASAVARSIYTPSTVKWCSKSNVFTRSWISTPSALSSMMPISAIACSARCTASTNRVRVVLKTISPFRKLTAISLCTPR
ncbi:GTP pyrophosphokinase [Klebsiella pneumoniae]|uniref:GTP pyrophosphokinase n=1 Tax=Klebsiella pneumoniae TaxID=573 RepID=A0A447RV04_KLEPN|nr:GTP pyrophosphokinase [Klebsiella pneumoniae]